MILSDDELDLRLGSDINLCKIEPTEEHDKSNVEVVLPKPQGGRGDEIPPLVRHLLSITATSSEETDQSVADTFNVGRHSISEYRRGLVAAKKDDELKSVADKAREDAQSDAHDLAIDNLLSTLQFLKPKLSEIDSAKNLATVAVNMSKVVSTLSNAKDREKNNDTKPLVIIHSVRTAPEKSYDIIDI